MSSSKHLKLRAREERIKAIECERQATVHLTAAAEYDALADAQANGACTPVETADLVNTHDLAARAELACRNARETCQESRRLRVS